MKLLTLLLFASCTFAQNAVNNKPETDTLYGFKPGSVSGFGAVGGWHETGTSTGLNPAIGMGVDIAFHRYLAAFGEGGYTHMARSASACAGYSCATASTNVNEYQLAGGIEIVGTNRSRFVPYAKVGAAYIGAGARVTFTGYYYSGSGSGYASAPAALVGGGVRGYISHNWGIDTAVTVMHTLGTYGGSTIFVPTVGVFFQSK